MAAKPARRMLIETGKIREYARATGTAHADYFVDVHASVPPTFLSTVVFWLDILDALEDTEARSALAEEGVDFDPRNLLSLEQEYIFHGPIPHAGDALTAHLRFDGTESKKSSKGRMVLVHFTVLFDAAHDDGAHTVAQCRYTSGLFEADS